MRADAADTAADDDGSSLYDQIVALTGIAFDLEESDAEAYKQQIVAWYSPADRAVGDKRYEAAPREVQDWVDDATKVARANKSARRKQPLPAIDGLPETDDNDEEDEVVQTQTKSRRSAREDDDDEAAEKPTRRSARAQNDDEDEVAEKPSRRGASKTKKAAAKPKASKKAAANGDAKEGRDPTNNCYGHVFRLMLKNPKQSLDQVKDKLNRDGFEYSDVSVGRVFARSQIFLAIAKEMGQIEA